jgi:undecaprenyl-diphosphatase
MPIITELGGVQLTFGIGLICLFFRNKEIRLMGIFLLAAAFIGNNLVGLLKELFRVPRPFIVLKDIYNLVPASGYSFPSGHSSNIFLAATILSLQFRRKFYLYLIASIAAFSRVYLGVHYPSDIAAGAALGLLIGYSFVILYRNIISENGAPQLYSRGPFQCPSGRNPPKQH